MHRSESYSHSYPVEQGLRPCDSKEMSKVTSKLQVTIPKAVAKQFDIKPGDEIEFQAAGAVIRVIPPRRRKGMRLSVEERLRLFDEATARQRLREERMKLPSEPPQDRGWKREDLYDRGEPR
jgi:AbrB family looped-hinge helix DNA binding protein